MDSKPQVLSASQAVAEAWPKMRGQFFVRLFLYTLLLVVANVLIGRVIELPVLVSILVNLALLVVIALASFLQAASKAGEERSRIRRAEELEKAQLEEKRKLDELRAKMTDAEWALYQVQLENQELLKEIKNKKTSTDNSPQWVRGVVYEINSDS